MKTPKCVYEPLYDIRSNPLSMARGPFVLYSEGKRDWTLTRDEAVALMESVRVALLAAQSGELVEPQDVSQAK